MTQKKDRNIFVTHGSGPFENARAALSQVDPSLYRNKSVLIKPNVGRISHPGSGINTHPEALAGVIEALREGGAGEITIGESPIIGVNTFKAFEAAGITEVAEKYNCRLIDFDAGQWTMKDIREGRILDATKICNPVLECDILLSLAVAKTHMHTGVTLGIKNMKGCLYRREKIRYHQLEYPEGKGLPVEGEFPEKTLDMAIADLGSILLPDITVIDGFTGMEGLGPSGGEALKSDFAIASNDPIGADIIGAAMMGIEGADIPHLRLIAEKTGRPVDAASYTVSPADFLDYSSPYKAPPTDISAEFPDVELIDKDSCSACLSTVMLFLKRFKDDLGPYITDDQILSIAIGKGITEADIKDHTILVGNCARQKNCGNTFIKGCPPVATRIFEAITGSEPPENEPDVE